MSKLNLRGLIDSKTRISTSPPLPGSSKKSLLTPSSSQESAWTSSTIPSFIHLTFPAPIENATHFAITFQGGFSASSIMVYIAMANREGSSEVELGLMLAKRVYPEDKSSRQVFEIPYPSNTLISPKTAPLPIHNSLSTEDLTIETERPPNPQGRGSPAPLHAAASNRLPASISSTLDSGSSAKINGGGQKDEAKDRLSNGWNVPRITQLKFEFEGSSDNQGRVTVYAIEVLGS